MSHPIYMQQPPAIADYEKHEQGYESKNELSVDTQTQMNSDLAILGKAEQNGAGAKTLQAVAGQVLTDEQEVDKEVAGSGDDRAPADLKKYLSRVMGDAAKAAGEDSKEFTTQALSANAEQDVGLPPYSQ